VARPTLLEILAEFAAHYDHHRLAAVAGVTP